MQELNFIDLFSGAGGLSIGLEMAGWNSLLGVDFDKFAMETYQKNHKNSAIYCGDICKLSSKKVQELISGKEVHAIVGGPPCQGFSTAGRGDPDDIRNKLFLQFVRMVKDFNPEFIVIENVTGLLAEKNKKNLESIIQKFTNLGYKLGVKVLSSHHFGVAEKRRRTIIIGTRLNVQIEFPRPTHDTTIEGEYIPSKTVGDVFSSLQAIDGNTYNHDIDKAQIANAMDLKRLKRIPEGKGIRYPEDEKAYLTKSLYLGVNWKEIPEGRFRQTKLQRLDRTSTSPTIMTNRHSYYHPTENRFLTQREAASIQSFPNEFHFCGPLNAQWKQIGNAVPPLLGKAIGEQLIKLKSRTELDLNTHSTKKMLRVQIAEEIKKIREQAFVY